MLRTAGYPAPKTPRPLSQSPQYTPIVDSPDEVIRHVSIAGRSNRFCEGRQSPCSGRNNRPILCRRLRRDSPGVSINFTVTALEISLRHHYCCFRKTKYPWYGTCFFRDAKSNWASRINI